MGSDKAPRTDPIQILYLEDEENDVKLASELLRRGNIDHEVVHVNGRTEYMGALAQNQADLILADYSLPGFDGLSALKIANEQAPSVPFILFTGQLGEDLAIEALKAGATDYVLKQNPSRLAPAVRRALAEADEHRRRLVAEDQLHRLSSAPLRISGKRQ